MIQSSITWPHGFQASTDVSGKTLVSIGTALQPLLKAGKARDA